MSYPFGEVEILDSGDLSPAAFLYTFTHMPTNMWYKGMHGLKENESMYDASYWNSSTDKEFQNLLELKPEEFKYEITHFGSMGEMFKLENQILTKLNAAGDKLSWNKWNGFVYDTPELPRLQLIDKLASDAYDVKSDLERKVMKIDDLISKVIRLQVRFDTSLSHKKISEYKNGMNAENNTKGFTLTIVRRDGQWVLVGGNHTLEAALRSRCLNIEVVFIDEDLTMEEMQSLGNALNRQVEIQRMTTEMSDCANDLVTLYYAKKITDDTFNTKWCKDYIKITGGFKGTNIAKVRKLAKDMVREKASWKKGKKWINWNDDKIKIASTNLTRKDEKKQMADATSNDDTLCVTSSATFRTDRIQEDYIKDSDTKIKLGLKPRNNIKILMHYKDGKTLNDYVKSQEQKTHKRILESFLKGEGAKNPIIIFEDLYFWEDRV